MRFIVGLGNPGSKYQGTRHNIGFRCIDLMAERWGIRLSERRAKVVLGRGYHLGEEVALAKPRTFMNNSGEGIAYLQTRFAARPADLLVIYDEIALPVGKLRIRPSGSDAGHNGVRSIIAALKTQDFPRIRVGIARPSGERDRIAHVLGRFDAEEAPLIAQVVINVADAIDCIFEENIDLAMNRFN